MVLSLVFLFCLVANAFFWGLIFYLCVCGKLSLTVMATNWAWKESGFQFISLGFFPDKVGVVLSFAFSLVICILYLYDFLGQKNFTTYYDSRRGAGYLLTVCGFIFNWLSINPWLALVGTTLNIMGGALLLNDFWYKKSGTKLMSSYFIENGAVLLLISLGCFCLASTPASQNWIEVFSLPEMSLIYRVGFLLIVSGVFISTQSFPFGRWLYSDEADLFLSTKKIFPQIFIFMSVFVFLVRYETFLRSTEVINGLGFIALFSALMTTSSALLQENQRKSVEMWHNSGQALVLAAFCFSSLNAGFCLYVGIEIASICLIFFISLKNKFGIWLSVLSKLGLVGFLGFNGFLLFFNGLSGSIWLKLMGIGAAFLYMITGVKLGKESVFDKGVKNKFNIQIILSFFLLLFTVGFLWTMTFSGIEFLSFDRFFSFSLIDFMFSGQRNAIEFLDIRGALILYIFLIIFSFLLVFWGITEKHNFFNLFKEKLHRVACFFIDGFKIEFFFNKVGALFLELYKKTIEGFFINILDKKLFKYAYVFFEWSGKFVEGFVLSVTRLAEQAVLRAVEVLGKLLRVVHSGHLQWQLLFALAVTVLLLMNFLKMQ
ncbi:MAG: hypothetical protein HY843_02320 [Bdellovibrio sp.]|nr:hypothetical protein [Bdellovibrio sp.]